MNKDDFLKILAFPTTTPMCHLQLHMVNFIACLTLLSFLPLTFRVSAMISLRMALDPVPRIGLVKSKQQISCMCWDVKTLKVTETFQTNNNVGQ